MSIGVPVFCHTVHSFVQYKLCTIAIVRIKDVIVQLIGGCRLLCNPKGGRIPNRRRPESWPSCTGAPGGGSLRPQRRARRSCSPVQNAQTAGHLSSRCSRVSGALLHTGHSLPYLPGCTWCSVMQVNISLCLILKSQ